MQSLKKIEACNKAVVLVDSVLNNTQFSKTEVEMVFNKKEWLAEQTKPNPDKKTKSIRQLAQTDTSVSNQANTKLPDSKKTTLLMYGEGKTLEEIASLREMAISTIEGHLAELVVDCILDYKLLITDEEIQLINKVKQLFNPVLWRDMNTQGF